MHPSRDDQSRGFVPVDKEGYWNAALFEHMQRSGFCSSSLCSKTVITARRTAQDPRSFIAGQGVRLTRRRTGNLVSTESRVSIQLATVDQTTSNLTDIEWELHCHQLSPFGIDSSFVQPGLLSMKAQFS